MYLINILAFVFLPNRIAEEQVPLPVFRTLKVLLAQYKGKKGTPYPGDHVFRNCSINASSSAHVMRLQTQVHFFSL